MGRFKYPLKANTFNQFKKRYLFFTTFFGIILVLLFFFRGYSLDLWQKLSFYNYYQILSILIIISYIIFTVFIYRLFKKNEFK